MKYNLFLYGAAAFILYRVIKNRRDNAAAAAFPSRMAARRLGPLPTASAL
jgi:hypothetical protein